MAHTIFNEFLLALASQQVLLTSDTIRVALMPSTYVADRDNHRFWSNIAAQEITGDGYTAGGSILTGPSLTKQDASDNVRFLANDISWVNATLTARYAILYKDTGDPATSTLIAAVDFGADKTAVNGTFTVQWNAAGIFTLGQAV